MQLLEVLDTIETYVGTLADLSEADCRARIIDPLIGAMGWIPTQILREPYAGWTDNRGFIDYLLLSSGRCPLRC